jgi:hypothetical protein
MGDIAVSLSNPLIHNTHFCTYLKRQEDLCSRMHSNSLNTDTSLMLKPKVTLSLTSALDGGRWLTPRPGRFIPEKDQVPIV